MTDTATPTGPVAVIGPGTRHKRRCALCGRPGAPDRDVAAREGGEGAICGGCASEALIAVAGHAARLEADRINRNIGSSS
ncbi:hypothetical protein [Nisaea sediminum]|uniref:hypothetical protein n=1 Tax=Nisaea sediminum TaxID=2775867 RepID=UPI0018681E89|nr:hypothetical protein [Nisaea sediminum]